MDPLAALSGEDSEASSSDGEEEQQAAGGDPAGGGPAGKRQKQSIDLETLKQHGYQGGLSVLFVPEKNDEEQNWAWCACRGGSGGWGGHALLPAPAGMPAAPRCAAAPALCCASPHPDLQGFGHSAQGRRGGGREL